MWERRFVLAPLAEIAPEMRNPATGRTVVEELAQSEDRSIVNRIGVLAPASALPYNPDSRRDSGGKRRARAVGRGAFPRMKFRSIAVEGPIGVGKTSFVERLAAKFDAHVVLEDVENPFLEQFYQKISREPRSRRSCSSCSPASASYKSLHSAICSSQITVCDYIFPKDKIFAYLNLDDSELLDLRQAVRHAGRAGAHSPTW